MHDSNKVFLGIDLDGTLLTKRKKVRHESIVAIDNFFQKYPSAVVAIVTGRAFFSAHNILRWVNGHLKNGKINYISCLNGSATYKVNKVSGEYEIIDKILFSHSNAEKIYNACLKHKLLFWGYSEELYKGAPIVTGGVFTAKLFHLILRKNLHFSKQFVSNNYFKINAMTFSKKRMDAFENEFLKPNSQHLEYARIADKFVELTAFGVGKSRGINLICNQEQIPVSKRFAVGDSPNDLDMFKVSTYTATPCIAHEKLKAVAKYCGKQKGKMSFSSLFDEYFLKIEV